MQPMLQKAQEPKKKRKKEIEQWTLNQTLVLHVNQIATAGR